MRLTSLSTPPMIPHTNSRPSHTMNLKRQPVNRSSFTRIPRSRNVELIQSVKACTKYLVRVIFNFVQKASTYRLLYFGPFI